MNASITFEAYRDEWVDEILKNSPPKREIRQAFARKIITQWLDLNESQEKWYFSEEISKLGFDLAYFSAGESDEENAISGDTWYLVKSLYEGPLYPYQGSVDGDGRKIIDLLDKKSDNLQGDSKVVLEKVEEFWLKSLDKFTNDRIVVVLASEKPLTDLQLEDLTKLINYGRRKLGTMLDVEAISIKTIYLNVLQSSAFDETRRLVIPLSATLSTSDSNLLVGTIKLTDLYWFLRTYRLQTGNLDQLFEKNVRKFLGLGGPINKAMQNTLIEDPVQFGLYNNGVTIVVEKFDQTASDHFELTEPYIVNGCQTTRTIWEVFRQKFEEGRYGLTQEIEDWRNKISQGVVVVKVVTVGGNGEELLHNITRYTNSQNAVYEGDFITLEDVFHRFQKDFANKYGVFLEVQRGGWESQKALQKSNKHVQQYTYYANAFELLKVYAAGWLRDAGTAFSINKPFLPGGEIYRQIIQERTPQFGVDDLYAAYHLMVASYKNNFGYGADKKSRRQTRYLFYMITIDLLKDVLVRAEIRTDPEYISNAIIRLVKNGSGWEALVECGLDAVDEYLTQGEEDSIFEEPLFEKQFNKNLNAFLKWSKLGKPETSPRFASLMAINKRAMGRGKPSPRETIINAIHEKA